MKRLFIIFALIIGNTIFTSCTDLTEENLVTDDLQQEIQGTGGGSNGGNNDPDPDPEPEPDPESENGN
ncbi:hypothetical protein [Tenacibaculum agarivorans]|uniref:hypothetical protein n=1 Tax=Tenacibaculum agarivorans TaxID=1908389 RepID=UPI000A98C5F0|nr:hypothetical protein [Tenacibaculum agarivorans]